MMVGKWLISLDELVLKEIVQHASSQDKGMSVSAAAKLLGVKEEVAYSLIRLGRLRAETVQSSRRSAQVVSLGAIGHFKRNYILKPEIALILGTSRVYDALRYKRYLPVAGPTLLHAKCRQYVWRRSKKLTAYLAAAARFGG
jgi:hypothetical protein